ncbi:hypothetical protein D3C75_333200 [compost metagenome]
MLTKKLLTMLEQMMVADEPVSPSGIAEEVYGLLVDGGLSEDKATIIADSIEEITSELVTIDDNDQPKYA